VGIAKVELPDPDLFNLPKMPVHGHPIHLRKSLPGRRRSGPSRLLSRPIRIQWPQTSVYQRV
jgi:hypothetical protein